MGLLSYSQLSTLRYCGEQLRLQKLKFPEVPAVYLAGGTAFHATADRIDQWLFEHGETLSAGDVNVWWKEEFGKALEEGLEKEPDLTKWRRAGRKTIALPNKEDIHWWWDNGRKMCQDYAGHRLSNDAWPIFELGGKQAIEVQFQLNLSDDFIVRGAIDRLMVAPSGELVVVDLKTGKEPYDATQLGTYAVAIEETIGIRPTWGCYYLARTGQMSQAKLLNKFTREFLTREYNTAHQMRSQGLYLANPGTHCVACGVKDGCPAFGGSLAGDYESLLPEY